LIERLYVIAWFFQLSFLLLSFVIFFPHYVMSCKIRHKASVTIRIWGSLHNYVTLEGGWVGPIKT